MSSHAHIDDDEWEETTMVVELNGVLDAQIVRKAINQGQVSLRRTDNEKPILQVANSLYSGKWVRTIGTDVILEADNGELKVVAVTDKMLKTEKALLTSPSVDNDSSTQKK